MPARIIVENENARKEQAELEVVSSGDDKILTANSKDVPSNAEVVIKSEEMEQIFNEWTANGRGNLEILPDMAEKMQKWIDWQKSIEPLKMEMAKLQFERFWVTCKVDGGYKKKIVLNGKQIMIALMYYPINAECYYSIVSINSFKAILAAIGNPFAFYFEKDNNNCEIYIDLRGWIIENGGEFHYDADEDYETVFIKI